MLNFLAKFAPSSGSVALFGSVLAAALVAAPAEALLPTSPRVKELTEAALDQLEKIPFEGIHGSQLGSKCLVGMALYKAGRPKSPRIAEAIAACKSEASRAGSYETTYSQGMAVMFLTEVDPKRHRETIKQYLNMLLHRQMPHGGWGYAKEREGDTSQTQYAALALWHANQVGIGYPAERPKRMIDWLSRTQDPKGPWGYKGRVAEAKELQRQGGTSATLSAAAMASLMIGADLHGLLSESAMSMVSGQAEGSAKLPDAVRRTWGGSSKRTQFDPKGVDWPRVDAAIESGSEWMAKAKAGTPRAGYPYYQLYSVERYESFREARLGEVNLEPKWYEDGINYLEKTRRDTGIWDNGCGAPADTAFAVLFMVRSTQKSLQRGIGEGGMISGRGLPKNLASAKLRNGQVIVDMPPVEVTDFLTMLDDGESDRLEALAADPTALVVGDLSEADIKNLSRVLRSGEPEARLVAARVLAELGSLDAVPALIYGMTDPDRRIALAARDGMRFLARRPRGFGMTDQFTDDQRYLAIEEWKSWYQRIRPEAIINIGR